MEQKSKNKKRIGLIAGVIGVLVIAVVLVVLLTRGKEEYRNIRVTEVSGEALIKRGEIDDLQVMANMNL